MTKEEAALLNAIAREPGEDLHRLAYADWLTRLIMLRDIRNYGTSYIT
jgi:hypothetical protein